MRSSIYFLKNNNRAKFHLDPIWNGGTSERPPKQEQQQEEQAE